MNIFKRKIDYMLTAYKTSCGYVHSTSHDYMSLNTSLTSLNLSISSQKNIDDLYTFNKNVNLLLYILFNKYLLNTSDKYKNNITAFCDKEDIIEVVNFMYGNIF